MVTPQGQVVAYTAQTSRSVSDWSLSYARILDARSPKDGATSLAVCSFPDTRCRDSVHLALGRPISHSRTGTEGGCQATLTVYSRLLGRCLTSLLRSQGGVLLGDRVASCGCSRH